MSPTPTNIATLLAAPDSPETGQALVDWVQALRGRILSGDMMIGLLSVDEVQQAPQALRRAIDCGIAAAWIDLATWQAAPPYGEADPAAAVATLRAAIAAGVPGAALRLAEVQWFHRRKEASAADQAEACGLVQALADAPPENGHALYQLGLMTCHGFGTAADPPRAAQLQARAAALGHAPAMFEAFIHHETGLGVPQDSARAFEYLQQAAEAGYPRALYNMGAYHATGKTVPKDMAKAAHWYQKAANAGNPKAMATLGTMYATGDGVEKNVEYAAQLYDEAEYMGMDVEDLRQALDPGAPEAPVAKDPGPGSSSLIKKIRGWFP